MCTKNQFLAIAGGTLLFGGLLAGDAAAQVRRMSMPPAMQPTPPQPTMQPMMPLNPIMGMSNPISNPWFQNGNLMNQYGYLMPHNYGNSMPYTVPSPSTSVNDVVVHLPIANAKVWINGVETGRTGLSTRHLSVPDGQNHEFKIKATWTIDGKTKSEERTVPLKVSGARS